MKANPGNRQLATGLWIVYYIVAWVNFDDMYGLYRFRSLLSYGREVVSF